MRTPCRVALRLFHNFEMQPEKFISSRRRVGGSSPRSRSIQDGLNVVFLSHLHFARSDPRRRQKRFPPKISFAEQINRNKTVVFVKFNTMSDENRGYRRFELTPRLLWRTARGTNNEIGNLVRCCVTSSASTSFNLQFKRQPGMCGERCGYTTKIALCPVVQ